MIIVIIHIEHLRLLDKVEKAPFAILAQLATQTIQLVFAMVAIRPRLIQMACEAPREVETLQLLGFLTGYAQFSAEMWYHLVGKAADRVCLARHMRVTLGRYHSHDLIYRIEVDQSDVREVALLSILHSTYLMGFDDDLQLAF